MVTRQNRTQTPKAKRPNARVAKDKTEEGTTLQRIYIGPSIHGLRQYTIFLGNELPDHVQKLIQENVSIRGLIVPITKFAEARKEILREGSVYNYFLTQFFKQRSQ